MTRVLGGYVVGAASGLTTADVAVIVIGAVVIAALYGVLRRTDAAAPAPQGAARRPDEAVSSEHFEARDLLVIHQLRRDRRIPVSHAVTIGAHEGRFNATSREISAGGMSMTTDAKLAIAQPVELSFELPERQRITVPAVVWWKRGNLIGVRFDVTDERRLWISKWVEEQAAGATT